MLGIEKYVVSLLSKTNKRITIMEKIIGLIDAPFTPFYENGDINLEPIPAYAKMLQKNGLKGVFINGSSGEGYMLTPEERMQLAEAWIKAAPEGFKVIVMWEAAVFARAANLPNTLRRLVLGASEQWRLHSLKSVESKNW
jgi:dihydrodipicolinate synthase/N-acetylneuraminate lyase